VTRPAGAANGDILLMMVYLETLSLTVGLSPGTWTKVAAASGVQPSASFETHVFWNRMAGEAGDITATWGGGSVWNTEIAGAWTGRVTTGDPLDGVSTFNASGASNTSLVATGMTTRTTNADVIAFGHNFGSATHTWGFGTNRVDFDGQSLADAAQADAGATGNKTATISTAQFWAAGLLALSADLPLVPRRSSRPFPFRPSGSRLR
jgi:hypothetical protein